MSGLVERVKGVVRSRSRHRQTDSFDSTGRRDAGDQYVIAPETSLTSSSMQNTGRGAVSGDQHEVDAATRSFAAMGVNNPTSSTTASTTFGTHPPLPSNSASNIENARALTGSSDSRRHQERPLSSHMTSSGTATHQRNTSSSKSALDAQRISSEIVPDRLSSARRKPVPATRVDTNPHAQNGMSAEHDDIRHPKGPRSPPQHRHVRSVDIAPDDPSPLMPHFTTRSATSPTSPANPVRAREGQDRDLRLPANFDLNNTERTLVETKIAPAVTAEKIQVHRHEIVTKAVHKDVHIDHHYTYIQPIPVREVLPARHFNLDPTTGVKTEISAPAGYKLPAHLEPHKAEDYSHLKQSTRHYLVDEDHPYGQLESPPLRHKDDMSNMQGQQSVYQNGKSRA